MRILACAALLVAACGIPENAPIMQPGQDCMSCHAAGTGTGAPVWTIAGTLYAAPDASDHAGIEGGHVYITDAKGNSFTLTTNSAGNFYTAEALAFPLAKVQAEFGGTRMAMVSTPPTGSCNSCHAQPPLEGAPGRLFVPTGGTVGRR